ncbi:MAG TPA: hypothetical protein VF829_00860 [Candidatus Paceibacterota bacterium]
MEGETKPRYPLYIAIAAIAVVLLAIGGGVGYYIGAHKGGSESEKTAENLPFPTPSDIRSVSGTIQSVSGNTLTIAVDPQTFGADIAQRTVSLSDATSIVRDVQKDPAAFQKEMDAFMKDMGAQKPDKMAAGEPLVPPMPYDKQQATVNDLAAGMHISVYANENIRSAESFAAAKVEITEAPAAIPAPAASAQ